MSPFLPPVDGEGALDILSSAASTDVVDCVVVDVPIVAMETEVGRDGMLVVTLVTAGTIGVFTSSFLATENKISEVK